MLQIDTPLVKQLVATQFPQWAHLPIQPVAQSGWDNRTFHLGENMLVRMPSSAEYAPQVEKEHKWLPKLKPFLQLSIPHPLAMGRPANGYPWKWSIYQWLEGDSAATAPIADLCLFAKNLAQFLIALQQIDSTDGPFPGSHNFYRGGSLSVYDAEMQQALGSLKGKIDVDTAVKTWETALKTCWNHPPVWVHGDISAGNLLLQEGKLSAVIDFGQLAIGDPACDLAIAWTLFKKESRKVFQTSFSYDAETWDRGKAWALWKAVITAAKFTNPQNTESTRCWSIIGEVLTDRP